MPTLQKNVGDDLTYACIFKYSIFPGEEDHLRDKAPSRLATRGRAMIIYSLVSEVTNRIATRDFKFQVLLDIKGHALGNLFDSFGNSLCLWTSIR